MQADKKKVLGKGKQVVIYYSDIITGTIKKVYRIFTLYYAQKKLPTLHFIQYVIFQKIILQTDIENRISFFFVYYFIVLTNGKHITFICRVDIEYSSGITYFINFMSIEI